MHKYYEFFAGGGMVRAGLGQGWQCRFANDFDHKKGQIYKRNWGDSEFKDGDVAGVEMEDLPGQADLAWASFPCQDLSLAGSGAGLKGDRSGTFWAFWEKIRALKEEDRAPRIIALENVCGTLTSHGGDDFKAICLALQEADYHFGAVVIDAALFVPQSRPRLFIIGVRIGTKLPSELKSDASHSIWHNRALKAAYENLPKQCKENWVWWNIALPRKRNVVFADLVESEPTSVDWHSSDQSQRLLAMMTEVNLAKVQKAMRSEKRMVGTIYKRTRLDKYGHKIQRAEIRFDDVAGCLRTPTGGSSRQVIMLIDNGVVRSRLISSRETARLMGLPDEYALPENYNEAYHLTGDGVVVPVVRHLAQNLFEPIIAQLESGIQVAA
jgi:DNA (cytosine-5)-methyltransferase 1